MNAAATPTATKLPRISFPAPAGTTVGQVFRILAHGYKFWRVVRIKEGRAICRAMVDTDPTSCG